MRKSSMLISLLLLCCVLSSCACEHQWTDADCLNPKVCSKCGETEADALGHKWAEANCKYPETCSRCGETRGAVLEHNYTDWTFTETEMSRSCENCGLEETAEPDRALYLEKLLDGFWDFHSIISGGYPYSAGSLSKPGDYIQFTNGRHFDGTINQKEYSGTWELLSYTSKDGRSLYTFLTTGAEDRSIEMRLLQQDEGNALFAVFANNDQILLTKNDALVSQMVGKWSYFDTQDKEFSLTFHEDRTVTCVLNEEFDGFWQLTPLMETGALVYHKVYITFEQNGEETYLEGIILMSTSDNPTPYAVSLNWNPDNTPNAAITLLPRH